MSPHPPPHLCFVNGCGCVVRIGVFSPLTLERLRRYVRQFPIHWIDT